MWSRGCANTLTTGMHSVGLSCKAQLFFAKPAMCCFVYMNSPEQVALERGQLGTIGSVGLMPTQGMQGRIQDFKLGGRP